MRNLTSELHRLVLPGLALGLLLLTACGGQNRTTALVPGTDAPEMQRQVTDIAFDFSWDLQFPAPVHLAWIDPEINDLLVLQLADRSLHGLDATSGMTRFVTDPLPSLIRMDIEVTRAVMTLADGTKQHDDRLYVIAESTLLCIDAIYGQLIWRYDLPFEPATAPYVVGHGEGLRIFIGDWVDKIRVIAYDQKASRPYMNWQHRLPGAAQSQASGAEGLVYVGSSDGLLACFGLDRDEKWRVSTHGAVLAAPAVRGRSLYVGASDNVLHAFNRLSGAPLGRLYLQGPVQRSPFLFDNQADTVFVWSEAPQQGLHAITAITDTVPYTDVAEPRFPLEVERLGKKWFVPTVNRLVGSSPRQLYTVVDNGSDIYAIDKETGNVDWRWPLSADLGGLPEHVLSYHDPKDVLRSLYVIMPDGYLKSYRIFGQIGH